MASVSNFSLIPDSILIPHNASHEDLGQEGEMIANDMVKEDEVIPFPHECHQFLTMELLHVFSSNVLVACGVGSGLSVYGGLLAGARVVAICASSAPKVCGEECLPMAQRHESGAGHSLGKTSAPLAIRAEEREAAAKAGTDPISKAK